MKPIHEIADSINLTSEDIETYGHFVAKITPSGLDKRFAARKGKYIVVTAITPTSSGEGKTTTAIGLGMALQRLGKKGIVTLRQPALGPLFGMKGGGAGGGKAILLPHEQVNLSLTGDNFRVTAAHNLLSSFVDNRIFRDSLSGIPHPHPPINTSGASPNPLPEGEGKKESSPCPPPVKGEGIDKIFWPRAADVNDRALRDIIAGAKETGNGFPHAGQFVLTEASEIMAILSLSSSLKDMRERLGRILVGLDKDGRPVTAEDMKCAGAMAILLKDALRPNLVQTSEGTPVFVHTGPFANIAPGISSVIADELALSLADYVITEAGFGADLGFEKLIDIKCRNSDESLYPDCAVIVCTVRSLKEHGGNVNGGVSEIEKGLAHLNKQISNVKFFGVPVLVAINKYPNDTNEEIGCIIRNTEAICIPACTVTPYEDGGAGVIRLGKMVAEMSLLPPVHKYLYEPDMPVRDKINRIATTMYGAVGVEFSRTAEEKLGLIKRLGFESLPVCTAKTHRSLSHDPKLTGVPEGFTLPVDDIHISAGAGFVYPMCGKIFPLPGLPAHPLAENMDIDTETWKVKGL
ncbi:MAG: formate--tetrahydrofolate ligase [Nitrospirae bacterium]|nr:formate--tetrahydrofolate ligase [Nitrospirota bacterium]